MNNKPKAFNTISSGLVNVLKTDIFISTAFDPSRTPPPKFKKFTAIWDTGSTGTVITKKVVTDCGLKPTGRAILHGAHGSKETNKYYVSVYLPNDVGYPKVNVVECLFTGADVLVGMDIITTGDFAVTNKDKKTNFSFKHPSSEHIDFVKEINRSMQMSATGHKIGRNEPCFCGSGKKFKKCHYLKI